MNTKNLNILELFSGIGGFSEGFLQAGWTFKNIFFSEIDKHAIANFKHNHKNSNYAGSVINIKGSQLPRIDIITFGSPCQDFSIAGNRTGLEGERSSLIREATRLISELRPKVFLWENVKGTFSSNQGRDFQAILREFTNIGGYRLEWQLLNTSWFLPQNRERIYLIGHLAGSSFPGVFPITENDKLFNKSIQSKKRRTQTKYSTTIGSSGAMRATDTFLEVPNKSRCITNGGNSGGLHSDMSTIEVGTLRTHHVDKGIRTTKSGNVPALAARARQDGRGQAVITIQPILTPNRKETRQNGRRLKNVDEPAFTLNCQDQHGIVISESKKANVGDSINLKSIKRKNARGKIGKSKTHTLDQNCNQAVIEKKQIRRLTEIECERLQGFPDNWTKYGLYNGEVKTISKSQRYKLLGNAVTVDVVEAIATKLKNCLINP